MDLLRSSGPVEFPLSKLVAFTEHKDTIRRGGVASTIKYVMPQSSTVTMPLNLLIDRNCSFEKQAHQALLSPETDLVIVPPSTIKAPGVDALPFILLPLAGPEEFDLEVPFLYCVFLPLATYHRVARLPSSLTGSRASSRSSPVSSSDQTA